MTPMLLHICCYLRYYKGHNGSPGFCPQLILAATLRYPGRQTRQKLIPYSILGHAYLAAFATQVKCCSCLLVHSRFTQHGRSIYDAEPARGF